MRVNILKQYHYYWKKQTVYMNQVIYSQGQPCNMVYLIKSGEFEQFITVDKSKDNQFNTALYTGPRAQSNKSKTRISTQNTSKKQTEFIAHVALMNQGMLMADEDTIGFKNYSKTARCKSIKGELYAITANEFFNLVKSSNQVEGLIQSREQEN